MCEVLHLLNNQKGESGIWANANSEMEITFHWLAVKRQIPFSLLLFSQNKIFGSIYVARGVSLLFIFSILSDCLCRAKMAGSFSRARERRLNIPFVRKERHEIKVV